MKAKMVAPPPAESTVVLEMTQTEAGALMGLLGKFTPIGTDEPFRSALVDAYDTLEDAGVMRLPARVVLNTNTRFAYYSVMVDA